MAYRCASTAPSSMSTPPGAARTSVGDFGHGGEHATGDAGEEIDAVQRGDALDETERRRHAGDGEESAMSRANVPQAACPDSARTGRRLDRCRAAGSAARRIRSKARFCLACGEPLEEESSERFRRVVTILFSDVVDSTGLGERLDPETLSTRS